jgi:broad specificity phosphatase PhoE
MVTCAASVSAVTTLLLVRHGETPANLERVWHGSTDTPLSERGRAQARRVAERLAASEPRPLALYTSPLQRALHTAGEIGAALGIAPVVDADLSEYALGVWEGRSYRDLLEREDFWGRISRDPDFAPEGGESVRQVAERFARAARRIAAAHAGARCIVVSHGGAMALGLGWLLDARHASWKRVMRNCAVSELVFDPGPRLAGFDDAVHLTDLGGVDPRDLRGEG